MKANVFGIKSDAIRLFLREYFEEHRNDRIAAAVALYKAGDITLSTAARLANVSRFGAREILKERYRTPARP